MYAWSMQACRRAAAAALASEEMVEIGGGRRAGATGDESGAGALLR
jgi:hypothetical protein